MGRRQRHVRLTREVYTRLGVPSDAKVVRCAVDRHWRYDEDDVVVIFEHESFDELEAGAYIPPVRGDNGETSGTS